MTVSIKTLRFLVIAIVVLVVGGISAFSAIFVVDEREQVVITQFGDPIGDPINEPGLHFKLPFIQDIRRFDKRILTWDGDVNQNPTLGREFIMVDTTARWRIVDPLLFLKAVRNEDGAQSRLDDIIDSVVRDKIASTNLEEIIRSKDFKVDESQLAEDELGRTDVDLDTPVKGRDALTQEILEESKKVMPQYGIELVDVLIKRVNYIDSVARKVEERMVSERQRVAEQFRSEGQGRSAEIDGETNKQVIEITSEAQRRAEEIKGAADAEATRIYGEAYGADPEFYAFFKTLESYPTAIRENTTLMIPIDSDLYRYLLNTDPNISKP